MACQRIAFIEWLIKQEDKTCLWAKKGPDMFDCSGLVVCGYEAVGQHRFNSGLTNTDRLWNGLKVTGCPEQGDLVFYGGTGPFDVSHVMVWWGDGRVYGACGATPKITDSELARRKGCRVKFREHSKYRQGDFRGFRKSPLTPESFT